MGKKKKPMNKSEASEVSQTKETKTKKNYSFGTDKKSAQRKDEQDNFLKVQIPADKEASILDMILDHHSKQQITGSASYRLSSKKLTDMYNCLEEAGFKHKQIEGAMSAVVHYGGDLMDALDWLCLNTPDSQLPAGFSQTFSEEENKRRPKFTEVHKLEENKPAQPTPAAAASVSPAQQLEESASSSSPQKTGQVKDWILRYAEQSSEDDSDVDEESEADKVNSRYLLVTAKLLDTKCLAAQAKEDGDKDLRKKLTKQIRELTQEMDELELHPKFDPRIQVKDTEPVKPAPPVSKTDEQKAGNLNQNKEADDATADIDCGGFGMFEEQAVETTEVKPKEQKPQKFDVREFSYTRQQWTGKSPKQFLIDWVRKQLPKSPPPSFRKVQVSGNLWKAECKVQQKDGNILKVTPDIVTENLKEAEHLSCVVMLYSLCKGQRIHSLLPPPYRDVWLEWADAEDKLKKESTEKKNKPRDDFVTKLVKKLKVEDQPTSPSEVKVTPEVTEDEEDDDEMTWEDLADDDDDEVPQATTQKPSTARKKPGVSSSRLRSLLEEHQQTKKYQELLTTRCQLPVFAYREDFVEKARTQNTLVVAGETGSGKSTQMPQYLLEDYVSSNKGSDCNIVCTEPRRISAMSLANRVSEEMGESGPGTDGSMVGYQIRFESKKCPTTRLLYCTTGVLLRKVQLDPELREISHVIVDEVHERSVESDFLMIILKTILHKRSDFRVILMSATLDADKISSYFNHCPVLSIPGRMFPVQVVQLEDIVEMTDYKIEDDSPYMLRNSDLVQEESTQVSITGKGGDSKDMKLSWTKEDVSSIDQSGLDAKLYTKKTRNIITRLNPDRVNMDIIVELLLHIEVNAAFKTVHGAVLVFMPGLSHIQELYENLNSDRRFSNTKKFKIIALHSVLSSQDQSEAFKVPPTGVRKIVIATNIAETGITIPDVVFVIDSGKVKENRYIESRQMSSLEEVFVSKASAKQRAGRAGRVREGFCFRIFTKYKYEHLKSYSQPEILRVPLEELCLHIMKSELGTPADFLSKALDPPQAVAVQRAMSILLEVGACYYENEKPYLSPLGHHLAALPVNVRIGKMMIYGAIFGCLEPIAVIAAAMTDKSPFVAPMGKRTEADLAREAMATSQSDQLTIYKAFLGWREAKSRGYSAEMEYCNKWFLKRNTLMDIENVSKDLIKLVKTVGFDQVFIADILQKASSRSKSQFTSDGALKISQSDAAKSIGASQLSSGMVAMLKAILTAGLYPCVGTTSYVAPVDAAANPTKEICNAQTTQGLVAVHPMSVNRFLGANGFLVYHEKVKLSRVYIRDCSLVSSYPVLLFGGSIKVQHKDHIVTVDDWISFKAVAKTGVIFKELRLLLDNLLERKLANPSLNVSNERVVQLLLDLIVSEKQR